MRVLLTTIGSRGDVQPMAALAARLRERGAEVLVCAPPDAEFADLLAGIGVALVPLGRPLRPVVSADVPQAHRARRFAAELVADQLAAVAGAGGGCDAIAATGLPPAGARLAAERLGVRYEFVSFIPGVLPSPHHAPLPRPGKPFPEGESDNRVLWEIDRENLDALYEGPLNEHRAALGLPPVGDVREYVYTGRPWLAADPVLAPWPGSPADVVQTGAWLLPDERPLPADLEAFLDAGEPPVYIGFGSMPWQTAKEAAPVAVEAVRAHGRRAVVSKGWADLGLVDDGNDCFAIGEANHQRLFARVAAVVHHGGAGTTTTAAAAGTPQLVVPQIADQPYWAGRVAALGIGAAHDGPAPTFASFSAALETVLDPQARARAEAVAAEVRTDGADAAADMLLEGSR
ncbi:glycosyltransferase [Glycomyces sp. TRM65418]|uniref:glycosyltransferase n=1 Tax=Glycomyces sp. TRM65418 TaxID=2867006 RepID=UPI001CE63313|nr:glycosyltransferase [Glycomyces sp. TRM65418]MCC3765892.1 glycosyltransferase [Glycomyces sp. TRM65418]QZD55475.1 glycosyltransferase [Glycomyces sp. TRM65418]